MRKFILRVFILMIIALNCSLAATIEYVNPINGSTFNSLRSPLILRSSELLLKSTIDQNSLIVNGDKSGIHSGKLKLADDGRTLCFAVNDPFLPNENVSVMLSNQIKTIDGSLLNSYTYSFSTTSLSEPLHVNFSPDEQTFSLTSISAADVSTTSATIPKPSDWPALTVDTTVNNPSPGYVFISSNTGKQYVYMMIIDSYANPVAYVENLIFPNWNFTMQPNGLVSDAHILQGVTPPGFGWAESIIEIRDSNLKVIDSAQFKNGYIADFHDFHILPNGHILFVAYDYQLIDMSKYVTGGRADAQVLGGIIQEQDMSGNVVFQWRTWDWRKFDECYEPLTGPKVDLVHINAVELDYDGNILVSSRHTSDITKINRKTGEIMWYLGGKKNQFTFLNETVKSEPYFSYQHDIRRLPNRNITLYDNGVKHSPQYSRAVEYQLDEVNKTCQLVWQYRHSVGDIYAMTQGNVQRLKNGNTVIGWGGFTSSSSTFRNKTYTEVHPDGSIALEISLPVLMSGAGTSYRAFKFPWPPMQKYSRGVVTGLSKGTDYSFKDTLATGISLNFDSITKSGTDSVIVSRYDYAPMKPVFIGLAPLVAPFRFELATKNINPYSTKFTVDLNEILNFFDSGKLNVFYRATPGAGTFSKLPTTYNAAKNSITATVTADGEFIIGVDDSIPAPSKPHLIYPDSASFPNAKNPIPFNWSPEGYVQRSTIQISDKSDFSTFADNQSNLKEALITFSNLVAGTKYYWRVQTENDNGKSPWSDVWTFIPKNPYITVLTPNGGEAFLQSDTSLIKWKTNSTDSVKILLYRNNVYYNNIADKYYCPYQAYYWGLQPILELGNRYKIRIVSRKDSTFYAESNNFFAIVLSVEFQQMPTPLLSISEIFPNPANALVNIEFDIPNSDYSTLNIYDINGLEVAKVCEGILNPGKYKLDCNTAKLAPGMYFCKLINRGNVFTSKLLIIK